MRIGIDMSVVDYTREHTGVSNYVRHLAEAMEKIVSVPDELVLLHPPEKKIPFWSKHVAYAREIAKQGIDVFHGPANTLPLTLTLSRKGRGVKCIITVHDLAIYKHPEWFAGGQWFATKFVVPRSIKRADKIIVPSEATAIDVAELFRVPREKIAVIPLGVEARFFESDERLAISDEEEPGRQSPIASRYILFIGTLETRKNVQGVIEAYKLLPREIREIYELYVVGQGGRITLPQPLPSREGNSSPLRGEDKGGGEIRYLGFVPDEDLPALYQGASVFVYPSFYEGFGLPVLEAMAAGVPVVTSRGSAMEEFAGGVAELVDPHSPQEIASAIAKLIRDVAYSSEKVRAGVERAREYSWERTAEETVRVYEESQK